MEKKLLILFLFVIWSIRLFFCYDHLTVYSDGYTLFCIDASASDDVTYCNGTFGNFTSICPLCSLFDLILVKYIPKPTEGFHCDFFQIFTKGDSMHLIWVWGNTTTTVYQCNQHSSCDSKSNCSVFCNGSYYEINPF